MGETRVEVALPLPVHSTFTYSVEGSVPPVGTRVLVPFRREERIGWVVGPGTGVELAKVRPVLDVLEEEPTVSPELMHLAQWMSTYYLAPLGMVLRTCLPSVLSDVSSDFLSLLDDPVQGCTPRERRLLEALDQAGSAKRVRTLRKSLAMGSLWPEIRSLVARGVIRHQTLPPRPPPIRMHKVVRVKEWLSDLQLRDELFRRASRQREAYFLEYAEKVRQRVGTPLVVTGGFRSGPAMLEALNSGATDFIGLGRPLALEPDLPKRLMADPSGRIDLPRPTTGFKTVDRMVILDLSWWELQLRRMGRGQDPKPELSAWHSVWTTLSELGLAAFRRRRA